MAQMRIPLGSLKRIPGPKPNRIRDLGVSGLGLSIVWGLGVSLLKRLRLLPLTLLSSDP